MFSYKSFSNLVIILSLIFSVKTSGAASITKENSPKQTDLSELFLKIKQNNAETEKIILEAEKALAETIEEKSIKKSEETFNIGKMGKITDSWKNNIKSSFYQDIDFMENIVNAGEDNKKELEIFKSHFKEIKKWFNGQLETIESFFDSNYKALMQKKQSISRVVTAQKKAIAILSKKIKELKISENKQKIATLFVLYEINNVIQNKTLKGNIDKYSTGISYSELEQIVIKSIKKIPETNKQDNEKKEFLKKLETMKSELEKQESNLSVLEEKIRKELGLKNKEYLELEVKIERTKKEAVESKKSAVNRAKSQITKEYKTYVEQSIKSGLTKELELEKYKTVTSSKKTIEIENLKKKLNKIFQDKIDKLKVETISKERENTELELLLQESKQTVKYLQEKLQKANLQIENNKSVIKNKDSQLLENKQRMNLESELSSKKNIGTLAQLQTINIEKERLHQLNVRISKLIERNI